MWDKLIGILSGGAGDILKGFKELVNEWHLSPDQIQQFELKAKEMAQDYQLKLLQAEAASVALENADRESARKREIETKDHTTKILAYAISLGYFGVLWFMMLESVPVESQRILDMMLGSLLTSFTGIIAYYFGSSRGSAAKQETIDRLAK